MDITLEMSPVYRVIPNMVPVALKPHTDDIQGGQVFFGVEQRLAVQGKLCDITRRPPAAPLHLPPLFRVAPKVPGLVGSPEEPVFDFPKALLALSVAPGGAGLPHKVTTTAVPGAQRARLGGAVHRGSPEHAEKLHGSGARPQAEFSGARKGGAGN